MAGIIDRRAFSEEKYLLIDGKIADAKRYADGKACICATGSYGRLEASEHSDLDIFIVGLDKSSEDKISPPNKILESELSRLDEICIKADLISACRSLGLKEFDADGQYLAHYSVSQLIGTLGKPEDDASNTFTARLLMLLEGRPLSGAEVFNKAIDEIIASYWRDYGDHKNDFAPAFLSNDILRLWRTFCVNYEARTETTPHEKKLKRRVKNYKLKFSRLLTCYSALLQILYTYNSNGTVSPSDMRAICLMTPIERIQNLIGSAKVASDPLSKIVDQYNSFLEVTDEPISNLLLKFDHPEKRDELLRGSYEFADSIFASINLIGQGSKMHRMLVV
ncbi:nucleotidyltransferase domain-containing protein [Devosia sp. FKR38]|uniref:nucleotidyltransferase domain-containing protein n=1 Tax=Devosia sp. FKR38 TaxID=2562312 RepID=UPI0010BFBF04|nr:nucleotidyltransferase domain-containing protein [Devosia sp. FKR38]